jgi:hypothetical protein
VLFLSGCADNPQSPVDNGSSLQLTKERIYFTSTTYPIELIDPGTVTIAGNNIIFKDQIVKAQVLSENPLINGILILNDNSRLNLTTGEGQMHGTFILTPDIHPDGEVWTGNFTATRSKTGESEWTAYINENLQGSNGALEGLHLKAEEIMVQTHIFGETGFISTGEGWIK